MGWFSGFKLHLPINHYGHITVLQITGGNTDDRQLLEHMSAALRAKGVGDKGYICQSLMGRLWQRAATCSPAFTPTGRTPFFPWWTSCC